MNWWLGWALLLGVPATWPDPVHPSRPPAEAGAAQATTGRVSVWTGHTGPYERGERARVFFSTTTTEYVTVLRIDTEGRLRILYPEQPWADNRVRAGTTVEIGSAGGGVLYVTDPPGVGYIFALGSSQPFDYRVIARGDHWDFRLIGDGRVQGDPYAWFTDLAARLAPEAGYDYDVATYHVEGRYDYPRFVCYECHAPATAEAWDPYGAACSRFRLVVYDDPAYYPYRWQSARGVVAPRPRRAAPRFVFREWAPGAEYVTRVTGSADRTRRPEEGLRPIRGDDPPALERPLVRPGGPGAASRFTDEPSGARARPQREGAPPAGLAPSRGRPTDRRLAPSDEPQSTGEPQLRRRKPS